MSIRPTLTSLGVSLISVLCALVSAPAAPVPHLDLSHVTRADIIATVNHLAANEKAAKAELAKVKTELSAANELLVTAHTQTLDVQSKSDKLAQERDWWKEDDAKKDDTIRHDKAIIAQKDHKLSLLGILLATAAAGLVFFATQSGGGLLTLQLAPYLLWIRVGLSTIVFSAVFAWVRFF